MDNQILLTPHAMDKCKVCGATVSGVEYQGCYDGVLIYQCSNGLCGSLFHRWSPTLSKVVQIQQLEPHKILFYLEDGTIYLNRYEQKQLGV